MTMGKGGLLCLKKYHYNKRARGNGMVTEWAARNKWGIAVAFGYTKSECMADEGRYCKSKQESS